MIIESLLEESLKAQVPMLAGTTTDPLNAGKVITYYSKGRKVKYTGMQSLADPNTVPEKTVCIAFAKNNTFAEDFLVGLYKMLRARNSTLIVLNFPRETPSMFVEIGELPVPPPLVTQLLSNFLKTDEITEIEQASKGLTLKQVQEALVLSRNGDNQVEVRRLQAVRQAFLGHTRGLEAIDTDLSSCVYLPPPEVEEWMSTEAKYFHSDDPKLRPRGLILTGKPGTGKTMSAKYIAGSWGVPLYRLDVSNVYGMYYGDSESRFRAAREAIDREEPCVMLIDEIEKLFSKDKNSSVSRNMLADLLWWLQEHTTKVLTLMTTNDLNAIPPEVWRPGRIDKPMEFSTIDVDTAKKLCVKMCEFYSVTPTAAEKKELLDMIENAVNRTYASVSTRVMQWLKAKGHVA